MQTTIKRLREMQVLGSAKAPNDPGAKRKIGAAVDGRVLAWTNGPIHMPEAAYSCPVF